MNEINGQFGGEKRFELLMDSGEIVRVAPLSIYVVRALQDKAEELFPFPDKTKYEKPVDTKKAIEPGQMIPASENPEYRKLYDEAAENQQRYVSDRSIDLSVEPALGREVMIEKYKDRIAQMRDMMTLPDDAWSATLRFCVIGSRQDYTRIATAIMGQALPKEEEILDGMRIFRCYVRKDPNDRHHSDTEPQSLITLDKNQSQHSERVIRSGESVGMENTEPDVAEHPA